MRALLSLLAFATGFLVVNRWTVEATPRPVEVGLGAKLAYAEEHADEYDLLFVGSSATLYGLRPKVFTEELVTLGFPGVRAYNLGVGGMGSFEAVHVLREVLARDPKRLAWVLYEEPLFDALLWYPDIHNPRYVHWHDTRTTLDAIDALRFPEGPPDYKAEAYASHWAGRFDWKYAVASEHLDLWLHRETSLGQGTQLIESLTGNGPAPWPSEADLDAEHGWMDISETPEPGAARAHERFLSEPAAWNDRLQRIREVDAAAGSSTDGYDLESLRQLLVDIRGVGAEPLLYVAPRGLPSPRMRALENSGAIDALLRFHDPDAFPRLADPALRWDTSHFNREGADEWSRAFARAFAAHLTSRGLAATRASAPR